MKNIHLTSTIGLILLALYFLQFILNWEWEFLANLQSEESYKRWSGFALGLLIVFQWVLTLSRVIKKFRPHSQSMALAHKWSGAVSPLLFYVHSMGMGYGYLALLSYLFFSNALLGYINLDVLKSSEEFVFKGWMILHVALSIIITLLLFLHVGLVFYYK